MDTDAAACPQAITAALGVLWDDWVAPPMALAAGTNFRLISQGKARNPPFMLRAAGRLLGYADAAEQVGVLHRLVRPFRRRILNAEL
jgi:hypothetical protein